MMYDIQKLFAFKKSSIAFLLGSGRSIRQISKQEWEIIKKHDIWTVNNWVYHPYIVPDFYHVEAKRYNFQLLQRRIWEKKGLYELTKFIFPRGKTLKISKRVKTPLHHIAPDSVLKFEYCLKSRDIHRTHKIFNADYVMDKNLVTKSYDMSMTIVFELMFKAGYDVIVIYGIDLSNSYYFWTGWGKCGEVHHQTNKSHENKSPKSPHSTVRIEDFIIDFNNRWMVPNDREIFVGHKNTLLYPGLEYTDVGDLYESLDRK